MMCRIVTEGDLELVEDAIVLVQLAQLRRKCSPTANVLSGRASMFTSHNRTPRQSRAAM